MHQIFVEFRQAYDNIGIERLFRVIRAFGISTKLLRLTRHHDRHRVSYSDTKQSQAGSWFSSTAFPRVCHPQAVRRRKWNTTARVCGWYKYICTFNDSSQESISRIKGIYTGDWTRYKPWQPRQKYWRNPGEISLSDNISQPREHGELGVQHL